MSDAFERHDEDLERQKARLIALASQGRDNAADVEPFLTRYFVHVAAEDVLDWPAVELYEVAWGHRDFAMNRPQGSPKVRVVTFDSDQLAGRPAHTLVEIITDDMPFLVDSVTQELSRHAMVGFRYDYYNPDKDSTDKQNAVTVPQTFMYQTFAFTAALQAPSGRLIVEYDVNTNHQGRDPNGLPTNLKDNAVSLRGEVKF